MSVFKGFFACPCSNIKYLLKLIEHCPDLLSEYYDGLPIGHFVLNQGNDSLLVALVQSNPKVMDITDADGKNLLEFALLTDKLLEATVRTSGGSATFSNEAANRRDKINRLPNEAGRSFL